MAAGTPGTPSELLLAAGTAAAATPPRGRLRRSCSEGTAALVASSSGGNLLESPGRGLAPLAPVAEAAPLAVGAPEPAPHGLGGSPARGRLMPLPPRSPQSAAAKLFVVKGVHSDSCDLQPCASAPAEATLAEHVAAVHIAQ